MDRRIYLLYSVPFGSCECVCVCVCERTTTAHNEWMLEQCSMDGSFSLLLLLSAPPHVCTMLVLRGKVGADTGTEAGGRGSVLLTINQRRRRGEGSSCQTVRSLVPENMPVCHEGKIQKFPLMRETHTRLPPLDSSHLRISTV